MNSYVIYLLKVCVGISIFVIPYYFFLRKDTNLILKRFYLTGGMVLSFIFPLLALKQPEFVMVYDQVVVTEDLVPVQEITTMPAETVNHLSIHWPTVIFALYLCGILLLLFRNVFMLLKWNTVWNRTGRKATGVAYSGHDEILAIFSRIFLPDRLKDSSETEFILLHEKAHIRQAHYADLILMEVVLLITWFNPFTWLTSWMMKENHEHLADRAVLNKGVDQSEYRAQLLNQTLGVNIFSLGYKFNQSFITKRFEMMKRSKSLRSGLIKAMILLPLIFLSLGLTVAKSQQNNTITGKVVFSDTGNPAHGASIIIYRTTTGTVADKDGNYSLELKESAEIVFSYVGYKTQKYWFNPGEYRFVVLERQPVSLPHVVQSKPVYTDSIKPLEILIVDGVQQKGKTLKDIDTSEIIAIKSYDKFGREGGRDMIIVTTKKRQQDSTDLADSADKRSKAQTDLLEELAAMQRGELIIGPGDRKAPLILVDNIEMKISDVDIKEIDHIKVMKDSIASSVFGARGSNGVVIISTKKDRSNKPLVFVDGVQQPYEMVSKIDPGTIERIEVHKYDAIEKQYRQKAEQNRSMTEQFRKEAEFLRQKAAMYKQTGDESEYQKVTEQHKQVEEKYRQYEDNYRQEMEQIKNEMQDTIKVVTKKSNTTNVDKTTTVYVSDTPVIIDYAKRDSAFIDKKEPVTVIIQEKETVFKVVEEMPLFNGGKPAIEFPGYIMKNIKYPEAAKEKGITGKVIVQFVVDSTGTVRNAIVVGSVDSLLNEEALRVVNSSPIWTPGKQKGKAVSVFYTFPIVFSLQKKETKEPALMKTSKPEETFYVVEDMPHFNGGDPAREFTKYISENLVYPEEERQKGIQGQVKVQFVIREDGRVSDVKVIEPDRENFNKEAVRVIESSPAWTPGKQRNKAVSVVFEVPVHFILKEKKMNESSAPFRSKPFQPLTAYKKVDQKAVCQGGDDEFLKFLMVNLKYPPEAYESQVTGEIMVDFVVNERGQIMPAGEYNIPDRQINSPFVFKPIVVVGYSKPGNLKDQSSRETAKSFLELEAYKVVLSSPAWQRPAFRDGRPVAVAMRVPVKFVLQ